MISTWIMAAAVCAGADDVATKSVSGGVTTKFIPSGITAKMGGYMPIRAEMDGKADGVKKSPEGLAAPKYGKFKLGDKEYLFILDEPDGKPAKLFVDTNNDGDLTNDPATKLVEAPKGAPTKFTGSAQVDLGDGKLATVSLYRFDPTDAKRAQLKNTVLYYGDYGYELTFELDGKKFTTSTGNNPQMGLWIDRDGNKKKSAKHEMVKLDQPFNFTGTTYVLSREGQEFKLTKAEKPLPIAPMPLNLGIGAKVIPFDAEALDGTKVAFPKQYAGKVVLVDFWATWCAPCIAELPHVKEAYKDWHDKGFEILGISFDNANDKEKVEEFLKEKELPWKQVFEGKGWQTKIGQTYEVNSIPFVLLVDGDTGVILGTNDELRGAGLTKFIGKQLEKKKKETLR